MSKISCIIVEDEPLAMLVLEDYVSQVPFLELAGKFTDAIYAMDYLREHEIDLIFLDIHLPKLKGMDFLKTMKPASAVIITTAYHQYAVEGYELNVTDYLVKPIEFERFVLAVNKVKSKMPAKDHLFINVQLKKVRISFSDILYIESQKEYVKIVTQKESFNTKMSTKEIEEILPEQQFKRVHRSFIVAINKIRSFNSEMIEINSIQIPVGRAYKDVLDSF
jgi:DNA-binding LytR/AlgR family response regulator